MARDHTVSVNTETFDYIVIGAGSSGSVVAARLSEDARKRILLIEAGPRDSSPWVHIPMGYGKLYTDRRHNWCYRSEPEPELGGRTTYQPRGKLLGGTGSINGMIYTRGQREDFDSWQSAGCAGWGYADVLPYFKKAEHQARGADEYHGIGGPIWVSDLSAHPLADAFIDAAISTGSPLNRDFNGASQEGAGYAQVNTRHGRRSSSASGHLKSAGKRANLKVLTSAEVTRIRFSERVAVGVEYRMDRTPFYAASLGETILCAGTFNSPKILELSGVGNAEILSKFGVPVVTDLPAVGENLKDHFGVPLEFRCTRAITVNDLASSFWRKALASARYLITRGGQMASNGNFANVYVRSSPEIDRPDLLITLQAWCTDEHLKPQPFSGFTIMVEHLRPKGSGSVHIRSADPSAAPQIRFNFFSEPEDRDAVVNGLAIARRIASAAPMRALIESSLVNDLDGLDAVGFCDLARSHGLSLLHPTSSCRMGVDLGSVVDTALRVRGVGGLRIVDASVMPSIPSGNTNAPSVMIAEKAADLIKRDN
ncbi:MULTISPECIES: GMC family oxidoreductase N-terminal domain-containing protein [unclassified Mesorhizobium]|uniref:GMC family oxidoreductase n=1 Tax=unclassified Mesorhizobium TaxID=325217 RepID=UPI0024154ECB|nr:MULTISPECIES: GMC family oxidoreductase N-terminal domain-containing protein [unclassified Mesorhizobium]MDG4889967.1 GMC family oxidoreductase N-terminal domain-containing protein [Mesorhizobium sp. WSM4887]MDG4904110.1 GMC family oxidoreductase N-terminal domain-containing protein [Mesorhizobium sp. WSM4962]MDG4909137.1 GMC family oxidoreductase N-terminal domain-containing protein [Mesorhizobium sp. WSM4898]MDG4921761.1 GMC family oxidoreductase N-terminal domain-containing protein [Mesor